MTLSYETLPCCPFCGGASLELLCETHEQTHPSTHVFCQACSLVFQNPRPTENALKTYYAKNYKHFLNRSDATAGQPNSEALRNAEIKAWRVWQFLAPYLTDTERYKVLDIGASTGKLLDLVKSAGNETYGVEPNELFAEYTRTKGHAVTTTIFDASCFPEIIFDIISLVHVLEHCTAVVETLQTVRGKLSKNGFLVIEVPNVLKPNGPLARFFQYPHLYTFSPATIAQIVQRAGFTIRALDECFPHIRILAQPAAGPVHTAPIDTKKEKIKIRKQLRRYAMLYRYCSLPLAALRRVGLLSPW